METKKKSKSVTYEQKQLLIDFVHKHPKLNTKKFGPSFTMKDSQLLWQNISKTLNETIGPKKTWVEWRKVIIRSIIVQVLIFNYLQKNKKI